MAETIHRVLDRIETKQAYHHQRLDVENVEIGPNDLSLKLLQAVYKNNSLPLTTRMRAALGAIAFESPKLIATAVMNEGSFAELLDRRLERMKQTESKTINGEATVSDRTIEPEPVRSPPLPSPLNRVYSSKFRRRI